MKGFFYLEEDQNDTILQYYFNATDATVESKWADASADPFTFTDDDGVEHICRGGQFWDDVRVVNGIMVGPTVTDTDPDDDFGNLDPVTTELPADLEGHAGEVVKVNATATGYELAEDADTTTVAFGNVTGATQYRVILGGAAGLSQAAGVGTAGQVLTSNGAGSNPTFQDAATGGGVPGMFGDGSDGALVYDGAATILGMAPAANVYTLTRDILATDITVNAGVRIDPGGYRIFATGTVTVAATGSIHRNGTNASGTTAGTTTAGVIAGTGGAGGAGRTTDGAGAQAANVSDSFGGSGGAGGAGDANAGGASRAAAPSAATAGTPRIHPHCLGHLISAGSMVRWNGAPGGSSGGLTITSGAPTSGAGGGGGAVVIIAANAIANSGTISANGGNGSAAALNAGTGDAGGGGGGGGGVVVCLCSSYTGNAATATAGTGAAGVGTGTAGADGTAGKVLMLTP